MTAGPTVAELVAGDDLDGLLRLVDTLCDGADWAGLQHLRERCRAAYAEAGRQLWPAAAHAEYRLALQAPGPWAAGVLVPGAGTFAPGPLPEVAASTHRWDELAAHLPATPEAARFAHERVCRGENLAADRRAAVVVGGDAELPLRLERWEPDYPLASYEPYRATFADVPPPPLARGRLGRPRPTADDPDSLDALTELVSVWRTQSEGRSSAVAVEGDALGALATLVARRQAQEGEAAAGLRIGAEVPVAEVLVAEVLVAEVDPAHALAVMAWAAASGGARGRRRGLAYGRFAAWWAAAILGGLDPDGWPHPPEAVGQAAASLRWFRWAPTDGPAPGWSFRLAAESADDGLAWAVEATDHG